MAIKKNLVAAGAAIAVKDIHLAEAAARIAAMQAGPDLMDTVRSRRCEWRLGRQIECCQPYRRN